MNSLRTVALSEVVTEARAGFAHGEDTPGGVFQVRMNNVTREGRLDLRKRRRVPANLPNLDTYFVKPGDVLFNATNSPELVGKATIFPGLEEPVVFSNHFYRLRPKDDALDGSYLSRWLSLQFQRGVFRGMCRQWVNQASVGRDSLMAMSIPLPLLSEQRRIAKILDMADALRVKRRDALAQLDELVQSVFLDMFGDPVRNPMGFPIRHLSEFYVNGEEGTKCGPFGSSLKKNELTDSGVPVWNMDNIDSSGRMVAPYRMWISKEKYRQLRAYAVKDGDVIISRAGTVGKMCVAETGCDASIISTNLIRVRFGSGLLPTYFVSLMTYCKGRVGRLKTGPDGAFTHMSTGILDKLAFPYPPLDLQQRFAAFVERIEKQRDRHREQLAEFDALFLSLQHRAFRGEL